MLATAVLIVAFSPAPIPWRDQVRLAIVDLYPAAAEWFPREPAHANVETPVLLPETPLLAGLPSEATVAEAARDYGEPVPGRPARLEIPRLGLDAPVGQIGLENVVVGGVSYYQWAVPNRYEAGWHNNSAPLGQTGNTVLNGHHNVFGEVFRDLHQLIEGDQIILYDDAGTPHFYNVEINEILPERGESMDKRLANARWMAPTSDERVTLITCWPYTDNSHRLVVVATPVDRSAP